VLKIIKGGSHADARGAISFVNDFAMDDVKRFYIIKHPDTTIIRGWRAHKIEQRWFYVSGGSFRIKAVKIDNWENPGKGLEQSVFDLDSRDNNVLHVPAGYATSLQALEENSEVIVFADHGVEHTTQKDNYLYPIDYFININ
jgi:dTDP-4-dehydrorhamnose 3,5-epimerase